MSKKPKGLSFDQKKEVLLRAVLSEAAIYNMKELEQLGRRHKVIPQAVPEVVEALIAERALCMDKIGTQNIYWAFPSQRKASLLAHKDKLLADIQLAHLRLDDALKTQTAAKAKTLVTLAQSDRLALIAQTAAAQRATLALATHKIELVKLDPRLHEAKLNELKQSKVVCDNMTENIAILRGFFVKKFHTRGSEVDKQFEITPDMLE